MNPKSYSIKFSYVLKSLENVPFYKKIPAIMTLWYNKQLLLMLAAWPPFSGKRGHRCEQSWLVGKASLHCDPLTHILHVGPIDHLVGREPRGELCWPLTHWQQACRGNEVVGAFARLSFAFPSVFCEYTEVQRIRNGLSCPV